MHEFSNKSSFLEQQMYLRPYNLKIEVNMPKGLKGLAQQWNVIHGPKKPAPAPIPPKVVLKATPIEEVVDLEAIKAAEAEIAAKMEALKNIDIEDSDIELGLANKVDYEQVHPEL